MIEQKSICFWPEECKLFQTKPLVTPQLLQPDKVDCFCQTARECLENLHLRSCTQFGQTQARPWLWAISKPLLHRSYSLEHWMILLIWPVIHQWLFLPICAQLQAEERKQCWFGQHGANLMEACCWMPHWIVVLDTKFSSICFLAGVLGSMLEFPVECFCGLALNRAVTPTLDVVMHRESFWAVFPSSVAEWAATSPFIPVGCGTCGECQPSWVSNENPWHQSYHCPAALPKRLPDASPSEWFPALGCDATNELSLPPLCVVPRNHSEYSSRLSSCWNSWP